MTAARASKQTSNHRTRPTSLEAATVLEALEAAERRIRDSPAIDVWQPWQPRSDAELLMVEALPGISREEQLYDVLDRRLPTGVARRYRALVDRRVAGEPVALVVGHIEFDGLDLLTTPGVFVPRLSSELLVRRGVELLGRRRGAVVVDVATGSGTVALGIAHRQPSAEVWGLDISPPAVVLARRNARRCRLTNAHFRQSDALAGLPRSRHGQVSLVTLHPPYVAAHEVGDLPAEIREFEPVHTLTDSSDDGLGLARLVADQARSWLRPGGHIALEVGPHLLRRTQGVLRRLGYLGVEWARDESGATRVVSGSRP